jgi:hypothetical protein
MTRRTFAALAAAALPVRAAESRAERGKRLVRDTVAALGGQNFLNMRDRTEIGRAYSFYREKLTGLSRAKIYTRYAGTPEPGKLGIQERQVLGKKEEDAVLFLDGQGFEVTFRGARPLPAATLKRYHDSTWHNFLYILRRRLDEPGLVFEHTASDVSENQQVDILDIFDAENENVTVYLSRLSKFPVHQRWYRRDQQTRDRFEEVTRFSKFHTAGKGVQWPLDLQRERDTEKISEIYDETVTIDTGLADTLFQLPSGIKMLTPIPLAQ